MTRKQSSQPKIAEAKVQIETKSDDFVGRNNLDAGPRKRLCERLGIKFVEDESDPIAYLFMLATIGRELEETQPEFKIPKKRGPKKITIRPKDRQVVEVFEKVRLKFLDETEGKILREAVKIAEEMGILPRTGDPDTNLKRIKRTRKAISKQRREDLAALLTAQGLDPDKNSRSK